TATSVTAGGVHTCALLGDGTVRCWGQNDLGQLGNGTSDPVPNNPSTFNPTPVTVSGITTAVAISAGGWHTCALLQDGTVRCWGDNTWGQMGNGAILVSPSPGDPVTPTPTPVAVTGITTAVAIEAGAFHTTAIAAASGAEHTCALLQDGTVRCWGRNDDGRLGVATNANGTRPCPSSPSCAFTPVTVDGLGGGVTWTSSDTTVATIDANGLATGRAAGTTTITATSAGRSGSTTLTVVNRPTLTVIRQGTGNGAVTSNPPGINC